MSASFNVVANKYSALSSTFAKSTSYHSSGSEYSNVECVWIDDISSTKLLSKTKRIKPKNWNHSTYEICLKDVPKSTFNTNTQRTERCNKNTGFLQPVTSSYYYGPPLYKDPFRRETIYERNGIALCDNFLSNDEPTTSTKNRMECKRLMESSNVYGLRCEFEIEQEFLFREIPAITSIAHKDCIRKILESFNRACNYAGLSINSFSIENHPKGFLSYKIGPCAGLRVSDELWMSRYILQRVAEEFHLTPSFGPIDNGFQVLCPRALYSFSTKEMRANGGISQAEICIKKLRDSHMQDLKSYNSTCDITEAELWKRDPIGEFSEVVTIPLFTQKDRKGCIVDGRPRGNSDPYVVTKTIVATICL